METVSLMFLFGCKPVQQNINTRDTDSIGTIPVLDGVRDESPSWAWTTTFHAFTENGP